MRTNKLAQAQVQGSYATLIQLRISLASRQCAPDKCGTFAWVAGAVLLREASFWFV